MRLSLSVSTTRLILLHHDAGDIIYSFGNFVVGGNIVVGLVIFTIITIVQFMVITKGAERVAEVSARFSLDGMPGKQMSIDGDMRAGVIDPLEAKVLRSRVQKESQFYGSMDGAMKFVKGDAIAGIIIVLVNLLVACSLVCGNLTCHLVRHLACFLYCLSVMLWLPRSLRLLFLSPQAWLLLVCPVKAKKKKTLQVILFNRFLLIVALFNQCRTNARNGDYSGLSCIGLLISGGLPVGDSLEITEEKNIWNWQ